MSLKVAIKSRWDASVLLEAEVECDEGASWSLKLGLAVKAAHKAKAYLSGADLRSAYLRSADLSGADLSGADLSGADLRSAYLRSADLSGADLRSAYLSGADLSGADLRSAYLSGADLRSAYLRSADLSGADLRSADLRSADLRSADLRSADLSGAKGYTPERTAALAGLPYMTGPIQAFKLVNAKGEGHVNGGVKYPVGKVVKCANADTDAGNQCSRGLNVADLPWCLGEWCETYRILLVEFTAKDIACVPHGTDGKFRLHQLKVVKDITDELRANGALPALATAEAA